MVSSYVRLSNGQPLYPVVKAKYRQLLYLGKGRGFQFQEMELMHDEGGGGGGGGCPWTDLGLLKTVPICLLDRKCPCEYCLK